jgi:hypothetical protein
MVKATTEWRFEANIRRAVQGINDENSFLPSRVWLVPEEGTLDDPDAVAIYFPTARGVIEVIDTFRLLDQLFEFPVDRVEPGFDLGVLGVIAGRREELQRLLDLVQRPLVPDRAVFLLSSSGHQISVEKDFVPDVINLPLFERERENLVGAGLGLLGLLHPVTVLIKIRGLPGVILSGRNGLCVLSLP